MVTVAALTVVACDGKAPAKAAPPPREVEVLAIQPTPVRETGEYLGTLLSRQSVTVMPQVAGYVFKIHVRPGQVVKAGDPLLDVDGRQETAALDSAQAQANSAASNLELARQTLTRTQALFQEGLVSAQELDSTRAAAQAAEAAARSATASVTQARVQLQYFTVKAPIAGKVGDVLVRVGDFAASTTPLTSIALGEVLEVSVGVPPDRARQITNETPVEVLDSTGKVRVASQVFFVAPQADPRTQLVDVKAVFRNEVGLRPSELVRTRVVYRTGEALQIPALAVIRQSGQPFVYAVLEKDGATVVQRQPVTLGALGATSYVVEAGLEPGTRVAVSSLQFLRDGAAILPKPAPAPPTAQLPAPPGAPVTR